jgi:hypothetical protein
MPDDIKDGCNSTKRRPKYPLAADRTAAMAALVGICLIKA